MHFMKKVKANKNIIGKQTGWMEDKLSYHSSEHTAKKTEIPTVSGNWQKTEVLH